ncbi:MAG: SDR family oxidoreductase [Dehalococcoidia bacterium]|nr:SDR family oxidoreductase [Dehalococcoidia bacterium]
MVQERRPEWRVPFDLGGKNPFDLTGRHALVAGASGALGRVLALALAEAGADVSLTTLHDDPGEHDEVREILDECHALGRAGTTQRIDLADPDAVEAAIAAIEAATGPIAILVNAAHHAHLQPIVDTSLAAWEREFTRNVTTVFVASQAVGRRMLARGYGRIINLVSILHDRGITNGATFGASQGAVLGFTKSAALEWVRGGVTVNAIGLGYYDGVSGPQSDEQAHAAAARWVPLQRLGTPEDVQGVLVYLASNEAGFMNSEVIWIDGALSAHA